MENKRSIAGMSLKGGRNDKFFFCLLEFYAEPERHFLRSLLQVKDEENVDRDDAIRTWINKYEVRQLVVDFPLSTPSCHNCLLDCPGAHVCPVLPVVEVKKRINEVLEIDTQRHGEHPKTYERIRNDDDEINYSKDVLAKQSLDHLLSRSFKRRLKKGFLPYWNRSLDFWVWSNYYDQLLDLFNTSYDSFGNTSLMLLSRFAYLKRHFPQNVELFEGNIQINLIELLRSKIILKDDILNLALLEESTAARTEIIKKVEKKLNLFIYDHDMDILVKNPRAFDSFILALTGQSLYLQQTREMPSWTHPSETKFAVPVF